MKIWNSSLAPFLSKVQIAELVQAQEIDFAVAGDHGGQVADLDQYQESVAYNSLPRHRVR